MDYLSSRKVQLVEAYDGHSGPLRAKYYVIQSTTIKHGEFIEYNDNGKVVNKLYYEYGVLTGEPETNWTLMVVGLVGAIVVVGLFLRLRPTSQPSALSDHLSLFVTV